jgi:hypothetical protein
MPKIRKIPKIIEAHQLVSGEPLPKGVHTFRGKMYVTTIQGVEIPIEYGEWVMPEGDGQHFYPCADSVLRSTYEFIEEVERD